MGIRPMTDETTSPQPTISSAEDKPWVSEPGADPLPETEGVDARDPDGGQGVLNYLMDPDEFYTMFQALVTAPNAGLELKGVAPLQSLEAASTSPGCRNASNALYATCMDVPWLRFLLEPEQIWLQRAFPVGLFAFGTYKAVRLELAGRAKNTRQDPNKQKQDLGPQPAAADPRPVDDGPGVDQGVVQLKVGGAGQ